MLHCFKDADTDLSNVKVDEVFFLVVHETTKVTTDQTVPDTTSGQTFELFFNNGCCFLHDPRNAIVYSKSQKEKGQCNQASCLSNEEHRTTEQKKGVGRRVVLLASNDQKKNILEKVLTRPM